MGLFYYDIGIKVIELLIISIKQYNNNNDCSLVFIIVYLWYCIIICIV